MVEPKDSAPVLVDPAVSRRKLEREVARWRVLEDVYRRRGMWMLRHEGLTVDVAFIRDVPFIPAPLPLIPVAVRLDFRNYDIWPPAVVFIDPLTGNPRRPAVLQAIDYRVNPVNNALLEEHPRTGRPFLCLQGVREYHTHPVHNGDDWLLYRERGDGTLAILCERIHDRMVATVQALGMNVQFAAVLNQDVVAAAPNA